MQALYIFTAILGGGLILLSALGIGGHGHGDADVGSDHEISHDASHDVSHDVSHDAGHSDSGGPSDLWLPFLSLRFWTYFVGVFGVTGLLLSLFRISVEPITLFVSLGSGLVMGLVAAFVTRFLTTHQISSAATTDDMLGSLAQTTVSLRGTEPGKVRMTLRGDIIDMLAVSDDGKDIVSGEEVVVVGVDGNKVRVVRTSELLDR
ncbi:MAG: hypothetical protein MUC92_03545 [Fimbriimonadaceae bacterium]|jgi:membrane protein implicated in regulation of membrane protease activity|nr:hypothetical protein [Fimbriimonadaceae bacterium]